MTETVMAVVVPKKVGDPNCQAVPHITQYCSRFNPVVPRAKPESGAEPAHHKKLPGFGHYVAQFCRSLATVSLSLHSEVLPITCVLSLTIPLWYYPVMLEIS